jgi:hypothetical protein
MWNQFQMTGNVLQGHAGGREHSTTQAQDWFIVLQARRQWFSNATTLCNDYQNATGVRVSTQTVRNRLHNAQGWGHGGQQFTFLWHNAILKSVCNGRRLIIHGQLMIGPRASSLMSHGFVWTSRTDGLGFGEVQMNAWLQHALQNTTILAGVQLWFRRE